MVTTYYKPSKKSFITNENCNKNNITEVKIVTMTQNDDKLIFPTESQIF